MFIMTKLACDYVRPNFEKIASTGVFFHTADFTSAYICLIIGPGGLVWEANRYEIMGWESSDVFSFDLWPSFQGHSRVAIHQSAYNSLVIGRRVLGCEN